MNKYIIICIIFSLPLAHGADSLIDGSDFTLAVQAALAVQNNESDKALSALNRLKTIPVKSEQAFVLLIAILNSHLSNNINELTLDILNSNKLFMPYKVQVEIIDMIKKESNLETASSLLFIISTSRNNQKVKSFLGKISKQGPIKGVMTKRDSYFMKRFSKYLMFMKSIGINGLTCDVLLKLSKEM